MSSVKKDVVYAWIYEQFERGILTEAEILGTIRCSNEDEWLNKIRELANKAKDMTPMEILTGIPSPDAI